MLGVLRFLDTYLSIVSRKRFAPGVCDFRIAYSR